MTIYITILTYVGCSLLIIKRLVGFSMPCITSTVNSVWFLYGLELNIIYPQVNQTSRHYKEPLLLMWYIIHCYFGRLQVVTQLITANVYDVFVIQQIMWLNVNQQNSSFKFKQDYSCVEFSEITLVNFAFLKEDWWLQ